MLLSVASAALAAAAALTSGQRSADALRAEFEASAAGCRHGHNSGVIIRLHDDSATEPVDYLGALRERALTGDVMRHHYRRTLRGVAARLSPTSLSRVFEDNHTVASVRADCLFYLNKIERKKLGSRTARGHTTLLAEANHQGGKGGNAMGVGGTPMEQMIASGVEKRNDVDGQHWNWGPDRVDSLAGVDDQYNFGRATGRGTLLYSIDTGVYSSHEDFTGRVLHGFSIGCPTGTEEECGGRWLHGARITDEIKRKSTFVADSGDSCDGHGTHTASIAAGAIYGVAKEADIVPVQGLDCNGTAANSMFIAALDWAVDDAIKRGKPAVMAMSLGGDRDELLDAAARRAVAHGFSVISASGNDGGDSCEMSPGADPAAISVGATDQTDHLASYSNRGMCTDILAPGSSITAAYVSSPTSAASLSGTSMATPHVAGAVLQLLQMRPHYNPAQIAAALSCLATKNIVSGIFDNTPNHLLHTGTALDEPANVNKLEAVSTVYGTDAPYVGQATHESDDKTISAVAVNAMKLLAECEVVDAQRKVSAGARVSARQVPAAGALLPGDA